MRHSKVLLLTINFAMATLACADTLLVPSEYATIQEGIDAAVEGDVVQVAGGTYNESITFSGGNITVMSETGAANTFIDGNGSSASVVSFLESDVSTLDGFTIQNGSTEDGAGMYILGASPTIQNCILSGNAATRNGGAIFAEASDLSINNVVFSGNTAKTGAGVYMRSSSGTITSTSFEHNSATLHAGGLYIKDSSPDVVALSDVNFEGNSADSNGGAVYNKNSIVTVQDSILSLNEANQGGGWFHYQAGVTDISNTTFLGNKSLGSGGAAYLKNSDSVTFTICTLESNIADSDCDGVGGSGAIYIRERRVFFHSLKDESIGHLKL